MARDRAPADEHVEIAVGIDVRHGDRPRHDVLERLVTAVDAAAFPERHQLRAGSRRLVVCHRRKPRAPTAAVHPAAGAHHVAGQLQAGGARHDSEPSVAQVFVNHDCRPGTGADQQILVTVVVVIQPSHTRPRAVETPRQLGLQRGVVVLVLGVRVVKQPACVLEERLRLTLGRGRFRRVAAWLGNLVNVVRLRVGDERAASAWPSDLDRACRRAGAHREHPQRLVAGEVAAAGDDLLRLPNFADDHRHARADAVGVRRQAAQLHRHARRDRVVAVNQRRLVEAVDDEVEVAVVVEVAGGDAVRRLRRVEPPRLPRLGKLEIAQVPVGNIGHGVGREHQQADLAALGLGDARKLGLRVAVVDVVQMAIGDEQVFVAVQIHVEEHRLPRPVARLDAGVAAHLGESAVAAIPKHRVARDLQALAHAARQRGQRVVGAAFHQARGRVAA